MIPCLLYQSTSSHLMCGYVSCVCSIYMYCHLGDLFLYMYISRVENLQPMIYSSIYIPLSSYHIIQPPTNVKITHTAHPSIPSSISPPTNYNQSSSSPTSH